MLDGIRAISIIWVVLHHLPVSVPPWLEAIRLRGDLGVELFFAVSGFLVTRSLWQCVERAPENSKRTVLYDFFIRRTSRIFPPYYLTLLGLTVVALVADKSLYAKLQSVSDIIWSWPLYLYNYAKFHTAGDIPGALNVMWSLAFEEQFYIFIMLGFALFNKNLKGLLLMTALGSIAWRGTLAFASPESITPAQLQVYSHLRMDAIIWGCLGWMYFSHMAAWKWVRKPLTLWLSLAAALLTAGLHHLNEDVFYWSFIYTLIAPAFTFFVLLLALNRDHKLSRWLSNKILVAVGVVSYEIYLVHQVFVGAYVRFGFSKHPWLYILIVIISAILAALLFHRLFSKPVQKFIRKKYSS